MATGDPKRGNVPPEGPDETVAYGRRDEINEQQTVRPAPEAATVVGDGTAPLPHAEGPAHTPPEDCAAFRRAVAGIGPIDEAELERLAAGCSADDVQGLARALVQASKLTPYQSGAIVQGKARGLLIGN
jgi:hypothetical protein